MKIKQFSCLIVIFSIWSSIFAPYINAQSPIQKGLEFRIKESPSNSENPAPKPEITVENLSKAETDSILKRLPPMPDDVDETTDFAMRGESLKPPKTGNVIPIKFPADETQNSPEIPIKKTTENLRVERFTPTGKIPLATDLSVTFSQPMIAVSTQNEASENVPIELTPEVKGIWRWLGTNTLIFDAEKRFPMATEFTAKIPKGTKSAIGGILQNNVVWKFKTPPPKIETFVPNKESDEVSPEQTIIAAKFNQQIDEVEILPKIKVLVDGKPFAVRSATSEVTENYTVFWEMGKPADPKTWIALRTVETLPKDADVKVIFEKGLPSAEGDLTSEETQEFSFKTLTPFAIRELRCQYQRLPTTCEPSDNFEIHFNRSMFPNTFDKSLVKIEPAIKDVEFSVDGSQSVISIDGTKKPNTNYKVTLSGKIFDTYKQPLAKDITINFEVGTEQPVFYADSEGFATLDPNGKKDFSIYSRNHKGFNVKLYAVTPADYTKYRNLYRNFQNRPQTVPQADFGKLVFDKTFEFKTQADEFEITDIDLRPALSKDGFGHAVLLAEPLDKSEKYNYRDFPVVVWIQSTNIGIDAYFDYEKLVAFAADLKNTKPISNAEISLNYGTSPVLNSKTDANGIAEFELVDAVGRGFILVKNGNDSAILREPQDYAELVTGWKKQNPYQTLRWFVFDDRKIYRPDETVSIKGYVRQTSSEKLSDINALDENVKSLNYVLMDGRGIEYAKGKTDINAFGAFDLKINLPKDINLGNQRLKLQADKEFAYNTDEFEHTFQVQEFRRPEFEVTAKTETNTPFFVGEPAKVSAEAKYYSGGFLKNAATFWNVNATPTNYTPPNRDDFTFGEFIPWWKSYSGGYGETTRQQFSGTTDANGKHTIDLDFVKAVPARPFTVNANAQITDVNRQAIASSVNLLVHPATLYVGIRTPKTFVKKGEKLKIETITTNLDGKAISGKIVAVKAELYDWKKVGSNWQKVLVDTQTCEIVSTETVASCEIPAKAGGTLTIKAEVADEKDRKNESELDVWIAGGNYAATDDRIEEEEIELIPDKKEYQPDDTAEILVNSPFFPAEGVLTLERNGILKTERFMMNESSKILQIPLEEKYLPNVHVRVDLVGTRARVLYEDKRDAKLPKRPAMASGELNLNISNATRKLNVVAEAVEKTLEPGGETKINVAVKDANGNASANTEVAVVAVDEGVLALTNYKISDPLDTFYQQIPDAVDVYRSRENVLLSYPDDIGVENGYGFGNGSGMGDGKYSEGANKRIYRDWLSKDVKYILTDGVDASPFSPDEIKIRKNFDALAIFSPSVVTDENGKATVDLKLPDNLTRYRITAVAVTKTKQFGKSESNVTAKTALQIRPSAPRFLNFGDKAEVPVVLQNQTDSPLTVNVAMRSNNAVAIGENGKKLMIPANERAEIRFPVEAKKAGLARFQIGAISGDFADAAEIFLPVYTPATTESFATYGTSDQNGVIVQQISAPRDVFADYGGLEVTTSSTQLQELTDAFLYLQNYPFECSEQISSRVISVAALRDVLQAFNAKEMPSKEAIEAKMKSDIERLQALQHSDHGWSFWRNDDESIPYLSVHVAHSLARAKEKGYYVSPVVISKSLFYLQNIEAKMPKEYSEKSRQAISAYALYVRDFLGDTDAAKAKIMIANAGLENLSAETLGWLLPVLSKDKNSATEAEAVMQNLLNRVTETASTAHFTTDYTDGEYVLLSSERRADGIILEAILRVQSSESRVQSQNMENLIPKIVRGLLAHRTKGRWANTQENAFVLLALDKYFQIYEKTTPDFVAKIWLGNDFAGEQKFVGRSIDSNQLNVPMNYLQKQTEPKQNLVFDKQGEGRLYYRVGLKYAPKNLKQNAADYGFKVSRSYQAIDDKNDVRQNSDGSWTLKAGARIRVNLQMVAPTRRYHVALVDNLPAGIEIINPNLATSGTNDYLNLTREEMRNFYWFRHQNFRDNRAEAFTQLLQAGVWNYSYLARTTSPGRFVVPPAKAEEMYAPETFGRSKTDVVNIR